MLRLLLFYTAKEEEDVATDNNNSRSSCQSTANNATINGNGNINVNDSIRMDYTHYTAVQYVSCRRPQQGSKRRERRRNATDKDG